GAERRSEGATRGRVQSTSLQAFQSSTKLVAPSPVRLLSASLLPASQRPLPTFSANLISVAPTTRRLALSCTKATALKFCGFHFGSSSTVFSPAKLFP